MQTKTLEQKINLYARTINVEIGKEVRVVLKLFDDTFDPKKDSLQQKAIAIKDYKEIVKKESNNTGKVESKKFTIKELSEELGVEPKKVKYVSGWIDADDDGEISREYDKEVVLKVASCCLTMEKFKQIFPSAPELKRKEVLEVFKKYCHTFEINTPLRVSHFFAQVKEEVGETINFKNESLIYSAKRLKSKVPFIDDDGKKKSPAPFSYFKDHPSKADLYGSIKAIGQKANQQMIANIVYADKNRKPKYRLGNTQPNDGWNFRGKGFIQLTGRTNYENANQEIQHKVPQSSIDIIKNPESILTIEGAMVSSMAYWTMNNLNSKSDSAGWERENVNRITNVVNRGTSTKEMRKDNFDLIQNILKN